MAETQLEKIKRHQKERFDQRKKKSSKLVPISVTFPPKKYKSKLEKKLLKIDRAYDKHQGHPLKLARLLKTAISTDNKIQKEMREEKVCQITKRS